jgi:hypothetical protein
MGVWKFPCMLLNVFGHKSSHAEKVPFQHVSRTLVKSRLCRKMGFHFSKSAKKNWPREESGLAPPPPQTNYNYSSYVQQRPYLLVIKYTVGNFVKKKSSFAKF